MYRLHTHTCAHTYIPVLFQEEAKYNDDEFEGVEMHSKKMDFDVRGADARDGWVMVYLHSLFMHVNACVHIAAHRAGYPYIYKYIHTYIHACMHNAVCQKIRVGLSGMTVHACMHACIRTYCSA
jgi:hypothetical protein